MKIGRIRWSLACLAAISASLFAVTASANGRFPRGQYLKEASNDPNALILSATYGLLVTADRGKSWYLACERSLLGALPNSLEVIETVLELTPAGTLLSGSYHSLRVSRDGACAFSTQAALPVAWNWFDPTRTNDTGYVVDLTLERAKGPGAVLALIADVDGASTAHRVYESLDDGETWKPIGQPIPATTAFSVMTLDVAPSDAKRIYVSGRLRAGGMGIFVSTDGGESWLTRAFPDSAESGGAYIAAIAADDPKVLYVRSDFWIPDGNGETGEDRLHYSNDGGETWTEILRKQGKLMGFALSPDGRTVLAGYGDPAEPDGRVVDDAVLGIYRADAGSASFTRIHDASISCLAWNKTGVYACAKQDRDGFHLGFAPNASFDLATKTALQPILKLTDVRGPLPWAAGTAGGVCEDDWKGSMTSVGVCSLFGACRDGGSSGTGPPLCGAPADPDAGDGSAGSSGTGGTSGAGGTGGTAGKAGTGGPGGATMSDGGSDDGCSCRVHRASSRRSTGLLALFVLAAGLARRRRRLEVF